MSVEARVGSEELKSVSGAPLEYGRTGRFDTRRVLMRLLVVGIVSVAVVLGGSFLLPSLHRPRDPNYRAMCASNMKQIGLGAIMYANIKDGRFPDDLETLLETEELSPNVLMCPLDAHDVPSGPTTRAIVSKMRTKKLISCIYVGKGLSASASADTVVLYEPLADHLNDGMNVLFADGHVEFLNVTEAQAVLKQARDGVRPIRYPLPVAGATSQAVGEK